MTLGVAFTNCGSCMSINVHLAFLRCTLIFPCFLCCFFTTCRKRLRSCHYGLVKSWLTCRHPTSLSSTIIVRRSFRPSRCCLALRFVRSRSRPRPSHNLRFPHPPSFRQAGCIIVVVTFCRCPCRSFVYLYITAACFWVLDFVGQLVPWVWSRECPPNAPHECIIHDLLFCVYGVPCVPICEMRIGWSSDADGFWLYCEPFTPAFSGGLGPGVW